MPSTQLTAEPTGAADPGAVARKNGAVEPLRPTPGTRTTTSQPPQDRLMRWLLLAFFAVLPLQWYLVPGVPLGPQRIHLLAIAGFTAFVLARYRGHLFVPVL